MISDFSFLEPVWLWGGLAIVSVLLVVWNLPRNLVAALIVIVSLFPGAWALHEALLAAGKYLLLDRIFGAVFAAAAAMLFVMWGVSAWALARRTLLRRPVLSLATTLIALAMLGVRWVADILVGIIFLLGE